MVKHMVFWNFKEEKTQEEKEAFVAEANRRFHALVGQIPGLTYAEVKLGSLPGCNRDLMLLTELGTAEEIEGYQKSPLHLSVANELMRPATCDRVCFDCEF